MSDGDKKVVKIREKIGFIGGGNMAKAICNGMVRKGLADYSQVYVSGPHVNNLKYWADKGVNVTTQNARVLEEADVIFLTIKPHILPEAVASMYDSKGRDDKCSNKLFISIVAGVTIDALENILAGFEGSRVIRVMTNTPLLVGEGCTAYCPGQQAWEMDISLVKSIFEVSGICQLVPESMFDIVCALAGSGPAFIYLIIEALSDGAVKMGLPRVMATNFASQTVLGAAKMVQETGKHTGTLRDEVCSPGGTTISGIHSIERGGVRAALMDAIEAATNRSVELGQKK